MFTLPLIVRFFCYLGKTWLYKSNSITIRCAIPTPFLKRFDINTFFQILTLIKLNVVIQLLIFLEVRKGVLTANPDLPYILERFKHYQESYKKEISDLQNKIQVGNKTNMFKLVLITRFFRSTYFNTT